MAIFELSDFKQQELPLEYGEMENSKNEKKGLKGVSFFSSLAARIFFLVLLAADLIWGVYCALFLVLSTVANGLVFFTVPALKKNLAVRFYSLRRSLVCAVALVVAIFSPSLGIMFASTYFLMYDKSGIDEIVPSSLQSQFKEFLC